MNEPKAAKGVLDNKSWIPIVSILEAIPKIVSFCPLESIG